MTDFLTVPDAVISPQQWTQIRVRYALAVAAIEAGGSLLLTSRDLGAMPLGRLQVSGYGTRHTIFSYIEDEAGSQINDIETLVLAVIVHKSGGRRRFDAEAVGKAGPGVAMLNFQGDGDEDLLVAWLPVATPLQPDETERVADAL